MAKSNEERNANYSVSIAESSKELTPKERVQVKDLSDTLKIESLIKTEPLIIEVDYFVVLDIHNEKADDTDYTNIVVAAKDGNRYRTGSHTFLDAFKNICDEMLGIDEEWKLKIYELPSKNREGKTFITCSVI